ncbi:helix-turn-helix domain-containing protein [Novosphingobium sp. KN65.2]|uniref:winged helix-turn-helix transcriptional regulator n=1 Tax=Novosphingobium sp. KN65.2 TaxID=1478134 RepID=UPI0005DEEECA|nr:helix-turn-helix domain-containing protein [Novosphingobium sp. KN65.2]CDO35267.1 putative transcriptional regulator [Novosphingobium sp. KN65.2]
MTGSKGLLPPSGTGFNQPCVVRDVVDRVGDRWSLLILAHLADAPLRFNALHRLIGDISKQVLARTLRRLEEDGFVSRTVFRSTPPQVEYALTGMGISFLSPLKTLIGWAVAHQHLISQARASFKLEQEA